MRVKSNMIEKAYFWRLQILDFIFEFIVTNYDMSGENFIFVWQYWCLDLVQKSGKIARITIVAIVQ